MALAITRKLYQRVFIGDDVAIEVVKIEGNQVRLSIVAPRAVEIFREELLPLSDPRQKIGRPGATEGT